MPDINVNKLSEILNTKADIDLNNTGVFSTSSGGVNLVQSTPSGAKGKEVASADFSLKQGGLEIGDIGFAPLGIDETQNKRRYLNGQVISQSQFASFTNKVKAAVALHPSLSTTETNWQSEKNLSKLGQCGKFVIDDDAGTIRLPAVVNAQGLTDLALLGAIKSESLPDARYYSNAGWGGTDASNCFVASKGGWEDNNTGKGLLIGSRLDSSSSYDYSYGKLSASNSTYQDNAPVQQEAVQYPYYIQVATGIEETLPAIREYKVNNSDFFGKSMYSDVAPDNASWLVSNGQWNAKATYPSYYDWLLKHYNGSAVTEGVTVKAHDAEDATDYDWLINTSDETFRLPLKSKLASGSAVAGNGMALGINTGSHDEAYKLAGLRVGDGGTSGAVLTAPDYYGVEVGTKPASISSPATGAAAGITTDPTKSGIETSSSGLRLYFYVGDTVQDASLINAGAVLGQLSDKVSRTATSDKELVVGWGMPDYTTGVQLTGSTYTATYKCWLIGITNIAGQTEQSVFINGTIVGKEFTDYCNIQVPLDAGDVVTVNAGTFVDLKVYAMKGIGNA